MNLFKFINNVKLMCKHTKSSGVDYIIILNDIILEQIEEIDWV